MCGVLRLLCLTGVFLWLGRVFYIGTKSARWLAFATPLIISRETETTRSPSLSKGAVTKFVGRPVLA